jgi:hypothetical protein
MRLLLWLWLWLLLWLWLRLYVTEGPSTVEEGRR